MNFSYEYLPYRGLTKETVSFFKIKSKIDANGEPIERGFIYPEDFVKAKSFKEKEFRWVRPKYADTDAPTPPGLFGRNLFAAGSHEALTITEGEDDAASLYQVLRSPVVSVQSASSAHRDCAADRAFCNSFQRVYLAFDNDAPGREAVGKVAKLFDPAKVYDVRFSNRKDANEYLCAGEADELRNIWKNARRYTPDNVISSLAEFKRLLREGPKQGIPYPFPTLTNMTYGIRTGESVLITAQEGIGKTELMHAIEHSILLNTDPDVGVAVIFLEERPKRHLQALVGIELGKPIHLPDVASDPDENDATIDRLVGKDGRLHVVDHIGSDDPDALLDVIRLLVSGHACRYVLLDHISMVVSALGGRMDERKTLDYFTTKLEMLLNELDFALIMVSHVNDAGQTRSSRYIGKIAHTRIDATRDLTASDPILRNTTTLVISKNRFGMKTGPAGRILFDPFTYRMKEIDDGSTENWGAAERSVTGLENRLGEEGSDGKDVENQNHPN